MSEPRAVTRVHEAPIQAGQAPTHRARHVLEPGLWAEHDPFLMLAEDWFDPGTFGPHPHRGFETVTVILEGRLEHRDNHGGSGLLDPGDAQWMTAGRGVVHSEEPAPGARAHTLQLWINLPASLKMSEPRYQDLRAAAMPAYRTDGAEARVYAGTSLGLTAPTHTLWPVTMLELRLDAGARLEPDLPAEQNGFVFVVSGRARVGAGDTPVATGQSAWLSHGREVGASPLTVTADEALHAFVWTGQPIGERVVARGPFVMNSPEEIMEAYADYREGLF